METFENINASIEQFLDVVHSIYGVYLDSIRGFYTVRKEFIEGQQKSLSLFKDSPELMTIEHLDSIDFMYGKGNPNLPGSVILHRCTQGEYKQRNDKGGNNYKFIGNMCIVSIYQYWEDYYRSEIANSLGLKKEALLVTVMGDLRILRRSIVHHNGIALQDIDKCEVLKWFKYNNNIFIDELKMEEIVFHIQSQLIALGEQYKSTPA
ncbi:MAG: hypothetical protein NTX44_05105 [Ignavibacteriales bacterium]|nr:hypothetical protein [Ignavibacteriales bacterium]